MIRLVGPWGGVWPVLFSAGVGTVKPGFAGRADVRYTADANIWCSVALGLLDARDVFRRGLLAKEGGRWAMDRYFHQVPSSERTEEKAL